MSRVTRFRFVRAAAPLALLATLAGCYGDGFINQASATFLNQVPRTMMNVALQLGLAILNGTSNFFFQSGGQFGGGFGS